MQILELSDTDINIIVIIVKIGDKMDNFSQKNRMYQKKANGNFRSEKHNNWKQEFSQWRWKHSRLGRIEN